MATLADMTEEVLLKISGYGNGTYDVIGTLAGSITASATSFTLSSAILATGSPFTSGVMEIGTELVYVQNVDPSTNIATGVLRGWEGSTASSHGVGSPVFNRPRYPRFTIANALNDALQSIPPAAYAVNTAYFSGNIRNQYDLPADAIGIIAVRWQPAGASNAWVKSNMYSFDQTGGSNSLTGKTVTVGDAALSRPIQVVYKSNPVSLDWADDFTASGLPEYAKAAVVFKAAADLVTYADAGKVVDPQWNQSQLSYGAGMALTTGSGLAKLLLQQYQMNLQTIQDRFTREYPAQKHWLV